MTSKSCRFIVYVVLFSIIVSFIFNLVPRLYLTSEQATGGDTASHFYTLKVLSDHLWKDFSIRNWNPGNLFGEPHLLHYYPVPFLFMAFLALLMPIGLAYNLGTILPLFLVPLAIGYMGKKFKYSPLLIFLLMCTGLLSIFNESHVMWGGNALSLLAGQFAQMYGYIFLFLFLGRTFFELNETGSKKFPWSYFLFSLIALSHTYVLLLVPFCLIALSLDFDKKIFFRKLFYSFKVLILGSLLSAWFVIPQLQNGPWMTANPQTWNFNNFWSEIKPITFNVLIQLIVSVLPLIFFGLYKKIFPFKKFVLDLGIYIIPFLASALYFVVFPYVGLVDARSLPQAHIIFALFSAVWIYYGFKVLPIPLARHIVLFFAGAFVLYTLTKNVETFPKWMDWNYSGWKAKPKFEEAQKVFDFLKGDFSQPRVTYEHHMVLNDAGTTRVWESLPLFSQRATLESLYMEANFNAPLSHYIQALVSVNPSCPIQGYWDCVATNFEVLKPKMKVLGVSEIILATDETREKISKVKDFNEAFSTDTFSVHKLNEPVNLVDVVYPSQLSMVSEIAFKYKFYEWMKAYDGSQYFQVAKRAPFKTETDLDSPEKKDCNPKVDVKYNSIKLTTDCVGYLHYLKFTYHPAWKSDSGDEIGLVSPGFMLIRPSQSIVTLEFGKSKIWDLSRLLSILTFICIVAYFFVKRRNELSRS